MNPGREGIPEDIDMPRPGVYVPDGTEGITGVEDLPTPQVVKRSRNYKRRRCPKCGHSAYRLRVARRVLHDLGDPLTGRPRDLHVTYSQHHCPQCHTYFNAAMDDLGLPKSQYTHRAVATAVRLVVEDGLPYRAAGWHLWRDHRLFVPFTTIQSWLGAAGKKSGSVRHHRVP